MEKEKLEYFKEKLIKEKKKQLELLKNREVEEEEDIDFIDNELSSYDNHPADTGTEVYMMEQEEGYKNQIKRIISQIDSSLQDIEDGSYGFCKNCNKKIKEERLELIPYAKTCLGCNGEEEANEEGLENDSIYESLDYKGFEVEGEEEKNAISHGRKDTYEKVLKDNKVDGSSNEAGNKPEEIGRSGNKTDSVEDIEKISEEDYKDTLK